MHPAHVRHGAVAGRGQVVEQDLQQARHQDDGPAPVAGPLVQAFQAPEQRFGQEPEKAVVNGQLQTFRQGFQHGLQFGADIQVAGQFSPFSGADAQGRGDVADGIMPAGERAGVIAVRGLRVRRQDGRQEVMLDHGRPAVADLHVLVPVFHIAETDFFVAVIGAGQHRAGVGIDHPPAFPGRAIPFYLGILAAFPVPGRAVFDEVPDLDPVSAALEGEYLGDRYALRGRPPERHFQRLLAGAEGVQPPFRRERIPVGRRRVADEAALYDVVQGSGFIQQHEGLVFPVQGYRVIRQFGEYDGPAPVDFEAQHVRLDRHDRVAGFNRAFCARQIRRRRVVGLYLRDAQVFVSRRRCLPV